MSDYLPNTYGSELLTLAVNCGVAVSTSAGATLPDGTTLDRLKGAYLEAAEEFGRERTWSWLCPTITVTLSPDGTGDKCIAGDNTAYALGDLYAGQPIAPRSSAQCWVDSHDAGWLRRQNALAPEFSGMPKSIAFEDRAMGGDPVIQSVLIVYPPPDSEYTLTFRAKRRQWLPRDLTDPLAWGADHNLAVRTLAEYKLAKRGHYEGSPDLEALRNEAAIAMKRSVTLDAVAWGSGATIRVPRSSSRQEENPYPVVTGTYGA